MTLQREVLQLPARSRGGCGRSERGNVIGMIVGMGCTHAITLNANREVSQETLRSMFGEFCRRVDTHFLQTTHVKRLNTAFRLRAIAFVEHPNSNPHVHVAALFDHTYLKHRPTEDDYSIIGHIWKLLTAGAGTAYVVKAHDIAGWGSYVTKDHVGDGDYYLAADFHSDRSVVQSIMLNRVLDMIS